MAAGFHIPTYLVEQQASGLQLVHWVRGVWGSRDPESDPSLAVVKLAAWLLADTGRIAATEAAGINIADVLGDRKPVAPADGSRLHEITGGEIGLQDWMRPYSAASLVPYPAVRAEDAGGAADGGPAVPPASRAVKFPLPDEAMLPSDPLPVAPSRRLRGVLGHIDGGPLFTCDQVAPNRFLLLSSFGLDIALERSGAMAAVEALAGALGLAVVPQIAAEVKRP